MTSTRFSTTIEETFNGLDRQIEIDVYERIVGARRISVDLSSFAAPDNRWDHHATSFSPDTARRIAAALIAAADEAEATEPTHAVTAFPKDDAHAGGRVIFTGTYDEAEAYVERNSSPDNIDRYIVKVKEA